MDFSRFVRSKPSPLRDALIARAARSWNPEFPGRMELPRKYARICWVTMALAADKQERPEEVLPEVCRIKGVDQLEVIEALEAMALIIEEKDCGSKGYNGKQVALTSKTKALLKALR
jgi:hypothetical protein